MLTLVEKQLYLVKKKELDCINRAHLKYKKKNPQKRCTVPRAEALLQQGRVLALDRRAKHSDESVVHPQG